MNTFDEQTYVWDYVMILNNENELRFFTKENFKNLEDLKAKGYLIFDFQNDLYNYFLDLFKKKFQVSDEIVDYLNISKFVEEKLERKEIFIYYVVDVYKFVVRV
jgi:hypothetical protein